MKKIKVIYILQRLLVVWFTETTLSCLLYLATFTFVTGNFRFILFLNFLRLLFYYWSLFIVYGREELPRPLSQSVINVLNFLLLSILFSMISESIAELAFDITFICNLISIAATPFAISQIKVMK